MADQTESQMMNDKEEAPASQPLNKKKSFKSIGLYITANAEFRKCIVRNRMNEEVKPIKLEDLYYLPNNCVPHFREKIQPKMSCQLKDTFIALSQEDLVKTPDEGTGSAFPSVKPLTRRYLSMESFSESIESNCSSHESLNNFSDMENNDVALPKISSMTEKLLLRRKELDLNIEKLKIKKKTPATNKIFSRSTSSDDRHMVKVVPPRKYHEPLSRTMSLDLLKKQLPLSPKTRR